MILLQNELHLWDWKENVGERTDFFITQFISYVMLNETDTLSHWWHIQGTYANPYQTPKGEQMKNCSFNGPSHKTFVTLYENSMKGEEKAEWNDDARSDKFKIHKGFLRTAWSGMCRFHTLRPNELNLNKTHFDSLSFFPPFAFDIIFNRSKYWLLYPNDWCRFKYVNGVLFFFFPVL